MRIKYLGHSSFQIKNKTVTIVTDPFDPKIVGLKFPKVEANIVTISHQHKDHNQSQLVGGKPIIFDFPGEYEAYGARIFGYQTYHDNQQGQERGENIMFKIIINNMVLLHCGDLGHIPSREILDQVTDTHILLVPVGGHYTIDAKEAKQIIEIIKPEIIIPMHYQTELNKTNLKEIKPVSEFLKVMGKESIEPLSKLELIEGELPEGEVILLNTAN